MGKKYKDRNGFLHLEGMPISRVQVAPYLGKQIDAKGDAGLSPNEIYYVYRSARELFRPETMKSFNGMPFRVGHQMLGTGASGVKSVDASPADGCLMNVRRGTDEDTVANGGDPKEYLFGDIVVHTMKAIRAIANGTKEFSLGYRCAYVPSEGAYDGQDYQFVQTNIVANHLALVPHGRAGSSVCVQDEAVLVEDGLVITCDSLPEEIQVMEENEKKAKDKLTALLRGSEENVQDCLDYCDLTEEQKKAVRDLKSKKASVPAQDKACKGCCKDELPPPPPPAEVEKKDAKAEGESPVEKESPSPAKPATPAPTANAEVPQKPAAEEKKDNAPVEAPVPTHDEACKNGGECVDVNPKDGKCDNCGKPMYTQDELDEAVAKAKKEGRKDALRAKALADAVGVDCGDMSEAEVARKACKGTKGLEKFAEDGASDPEVLAAIRAHLATKVAEADAQDEAVERQKTKKTILTVAQDAAIAKTPRTFSAAALNKYLGAH